MRFPTIHLNGTSADALYEQVRTARLALLEAMVALDEAAPNARDYYPQGDEAFGEAATEHRSRIARMRSVVGELDTILTNIADVAGDRLTR